MKSRLIILSIIILAAILRIANLNSIPVGFNDDEAAFGYNAYTILKTGHDEWGNRLPFPVFESFGDWKLVGYLYLTVASVAFFGMNELATRLPSVAFGILSVFVTYLLSKKLFNKETGYIAAFLLAISPWHIIASRNAFESDVMIFFITTGTYFFLKGFDSRRYFVFSALSFVTSFYFYRSSWTFVPLFLLTLAYFSRKELKKSGFRLKKYFLLTALLLLPLVPVVLTFQGQSRFLQESFISGVSRTGLTNNISEKQSRCQTKAPQIICKAAHNKYSTFLSTYINNYFGNLSYATFFSKANPYGFQSFATRSTFYLFELPLFIAGVVFMVKKRTRAAKILIPWILLVPLGASITGIANYGRINIIMPAPQIIAAFGLVSAISAVKIPKFKLALAGLIAIIATLSFTSFYSELFLTEPYVTSRHQRYGYKQLFGYLNTKESEYGNIYISKKIDNSHQYIQYAFFQKLDPDYFVENAKRERGKNGWTEFASIGKYYFISSAPAAGNLPGKSLIVVGEHETEYRAKPEFVINDLRGDIIFKVFDTDKVREGLEEKMRI
ncbi:MAG: glycosyltransferase family 39 protein [Candidatus Curtissbacteria bacterium]